MRRRFLYSFVSTLLIAQTAVVAYLAQDHVRNPPATVRVGETRDLSPELDGLGRRLTDLESFKADLEGLRRAVASLPEGGGEFDASSILQRLSVLEARLGPRLGGLSSLESKIDLIRDCVKKIEGAYNRHTHQQNPPGDRSYNQPQTDGPGYPTVSCYLY